MTRKKYVTEKDFNDHETWLGNHHRHSWLYVIVVSLCIILLVTFFAVVSFRQELEQTNQFIASDYDFTEDECVEWEELVGYGKFEKQEFKEGRTHFYNCSQYCHTEERQVYENGVPKEECIITNQLDAECYHPCMDDLNDVERCIWNCPVTVCIPVTETIQWGCQSGDAVREARELK